MGEQTMIQAYHWLRADMRAGSGRERPWTVGETRSVPTAELCGRGYHSSPTLLDALGYAPGPVACLVEVSEPVASDATPNAAKQVSLSRRLVAAVNVERELRLWGCECAERALRRERERGREPDPRCWAAVETARRYANGQATAEELAAAGDAARAVARDATWDAAWDAGDAAGAAAWAAAWAAEAAAWAAWAAWAAARAAAWAARAAAWDAARAAAWDAAWAAGAAGAAARDARDATWAAARDAEIAWQRQRFDAMVTAILLAEVQ